LERIEKRRSSNMRDMAKALGGHHHGHRHHHAGPSQALAAYQSNTSQTGALDPMSIASDTISQSIAD
jgi:MOSC domain-containing protein YiiM